MSKPDIIDELFAPEERTDAPDPDEERYPGSRRSRRTGPEPEYVLPWREDYTVKTIHGLARKFYAVGALAAALKVSVPTVRRWSTRGLLPQAAYRLPVSIVNGKKYPGRRLYTTAMIEAAIAEFDKRDLIGKPRVEWKDHADLTIAIHDAWTSINAREKAEYAHARATYVPPPPAA